MSDDGIVLCNYIPVIMTKNEVSVRSRDEYHVFMETYKKKHALCPKCGAINYSTTYVGYILHLDSKEEYKDLNKCKCSECGHSHSTHDRIELFNKERCLTNVGVDQQVGNTTGH